MPQLQNPVLVPLFLGVRVYSFNIDRRLLLTPQVLVAELLFEVENQKKNRDANFCEWSLSKSLRFRV